MMFITFFSITLGMEHMRLEVYKTYRNNDPGLTMTYLRTRSDLVIYLLCGQKLSGSD